MVRRKEADYSDWGSEMKVYNGERELVAGEDYDADEYRHIGIDVGVKEGFGVSLAGSVPVAVPDAPLESPGGGVEKIEGGNGGGVEEVSAVPKILGVDGTGAELPANVRPAVLGDDGLVLDKVRDGVESLTGLKVARVVRADGLGDGRRRYRVKFYKGKGNQAVGRMLVEGVFKNEGELISRICKSIGDCKLKYLSDGDAPNWGALPK